MNNIFERLLMFKVIIKPTNLRKHSDHLRKHAYSIVIVHSEQAYLFISFHLI